MKKSCFIKHNFIIHRRHTSICPNSKTSLTEIMKLINEYSIISDYTRNWTKSTILPLNMKTYGRRIQDIPLKIYFGINTSQNLSDLFSFNFNPLLKTIEEDLTRWMNLPLSIRQQLKCVFYQNSIHSP